MKKILFSVLLLGLLQLTANAQETHHTTTHHKPVHHTKKKSHHTAKKHSNIKVSDNDDHAAYEGKKSHSNDGVKKNHNRNLNYQNNSQPLPPSDGNNARH